MLLGSACCWVDALPRVYFKRTMPTFIHLLFYPQHNAFSTSFLIIYVAKFRQTEFSPIPANLVCSRSQIRLHNFCLYYICLHYICLYYTVTRWVKLKQILQSQNSCFVSKLSMELSLFSSAAESVDIHHDKSASLTTQKEQKITNSSWYSLIISHTAVCKSFSFHHNYLTHSKSILMTVGRK